VDGRRHVPAVLPLESPGTHYKTDWVGSKADLDTYETPPPRFYPRTVHPVAIRYTD